MARLLVEQGLHSQVLGRIAEEGGDRWRQHAANVSGTRLGDRRIADLNMVDWSVPYVELAFPSDRRVPSRLGESDRRVLFPRPVRTPFGNRVRELTIKASWARDVPPDVWEATGVVESEARFRFRYGPTDFVYDRMGLAARARAAADDRARRWRMTMKR